MTWDVDYLRDNRDENMGFLSKTLLPDGTEIPGTNFDYNYLQHRKVDVVSSALDFILPFEKYKITAGAKVSFTNTRNGINYDTSDPTLVQDDYFRYKEQIYALYADYSREFSDVFHAVGLAYGAHPHYRYFRSEGYGGQARLYALIPYCLSALFAY